MSICDKSQTGGLAYASFLFVQFFLQKGFRSKPEPDSEGSSLHLDSDLLASFKANSAF